MEPLYKIYKINEIEQLKSFLVNKGYLFENTEFWMCRNDKNSVEPALSVCFGGNHNTAGVLRDSQGLLFVLINKDAGKNLDKLIESSKFE